MTRQTPDDAPGTELFPEYATLYDLIAPEVEGLTDKQLDFESDRWEWSKWSIRTQLSHMGAVIYRWLAVRWGETLFPHGEHGVEDLTVIADAADRRLDSERYLEIEDVMTKAGGRDRPGPAGPGQSLRRLPAKPHPLPRGRRSLPSRSSR